MPVLPNLVQPLPPVSEESIFSYVRSYLGSPIQKVELDDCQLRSFLSNSIDIYSRVIPQIRWFSIPAFPGVQRYELQKDTCGYGVVEVMIPRIDPIAPLLLSSGPRLDIFGYRYSYPYRDISELFIDYMYFKEATRVLSAEFDWNYIENALYIHPKPDEPFTLTYASAFPQELNAFPPADVDWLRKHVLAQATVALGHIRSKAPIPSPTGQQIWLNGRELVMEGRELLAEAETDLYNRIPPYPLFRT